MYGYNLNVRSANDTEFGYTFIIDDLLSRFKYFINCSDQITGSKEQTYSISFGNKKPAVKAKKYINKPREHRRI